MRKIPAIAATVAALLCAPAQAFMVDLTEEVGYLGVKVTATRVHHAVAVHIVNADPLAVDCAIRFDTGPDTKTRRIRVNGNDEKTVSYTIRRPNTQRVRVHAVCKGEGVAGDDGG